MEVRITRFEQTSELDDNLRPREVMRVTFFVGSQGPFLETFPMLKFTQNDIKAKLEERAEVIRALAPDEP